ncbi:MAG: hypothetical protein HRU20_23475 [Pseudomonadales bacterium]|nr:hypothetical protein [Pseudomonadales bacterium]
MKYIATCFLFSCVFSTALLSAELSDSLRKVGTKMTVNKDGFISVNFSVPSPPRGPFGQPVFYPNYKTPPPVTAQHLAEVANIPKLHSLSLRGAPLNVSVTDIFRILAGAKELRRLDLTMVKGVTDESLGQIVGLSALEDLSLDNCGSVTNLGLEEVAKLKNLRSLNLVSTQVDDDGMYFLKHATNLESLNLNFTRVDGQGLLHLAELPKLTSINIQRNRSTADMTRMNLSALGRGFSALRRLSVGGNHITDANVASLTSLTNLQSLTFHTIGFTQITDDGVAMLSNLSDLRELRIDGSVNVTNIGVAHLAKLKKL